jgi:hypothetical protein
MVKSFSRASILGLGLTLALPTLGNAQDIFLASGGADLTWKGTATGANAGVWMDLGSVSTDTRRDLIVGAPGTSGTSGTVYVIIGGPSRTGDLSLSSADVIITSSAAGNRFGTATAVGNIRNAEGTALKNLVVGAPGALSNRGEVYLFTGGFASGASLSTSSAVFKIQGATGDEIGSALATGDLDGDTFRELIIGAPGNSRVYVIKGGPSLSGTLDLSGGLPACAAAADVNCAIQAPGIGRNLSAGDVTGDSIYDLLIGAPSNNVVYLFPGVTGIMPPAATTSFSGADAGDEAGTSIRILDIDADGKNDLAIGAPGGDGPSNGRLNAGEVSVFLGPVNTPGARSLASAGIVFYGAAANYRAGDIVATGDINRDTPNDLVINESGGSGGSGVLDIYYGRSRSTIGAVQGSQRVVDFSVTGQANRRIFGDAATGPIRAVQVFEVTGEGARDIIVGVPAFDSNTGKLYFTISPKLRISRTTMALTVNQGGTVISSTPINVTNPSIVTTGWTATFPSDAPVDERWVAATPAAGTVDSTHPNSFNVVASSAGLSPGVHTATLEVTSTSPDLTMTLPVDVTLTVTGATVTIDAPSDGATVSNGFTIAGWAIDLAAATGTGVSQVQAYAYQSSGAPIFLGTATYGASRPDVGGVYGSRFTPSGYTMTVSNLTPGASYQISVFAKSTVTNAFASSRSINVSVSSSSPGPSPGPTDPNPTPPPNPNNPGPGGCAVPIPNASTRVAVNRTGLFFGATNNGAMKTAGQPATVTFSGGCGTWSATTNASWIDLSSASGTGAGKFTAAVKTGTYAAGTLLNGTITVTAPGVANSPLTIPVQLRAYSSPANPIGSIDTPANNAQGIVGSIGVTGWAVDDIGVTQVTIWRNPMPGEASATNGKVFIGNAVQVDGARPDVDATYSYPFDFQAGWGYLLLTNMLPNQGNGTFTLFAYADDVEGHRVLLGSRTITCDNAHATKPFGAIDTPTQGGTASGTAYVNFGWALTPTSNPIPVDGSTIMVYIDGVPVGHPTYNQFRSDIASLFPGRPNSGGAVGFLTLNTTTLADGVHTIAWGVTDSAGNAEGIGSRYFTVLNGAASSSITVERSSSTQSAMGQALEVRQSATAGDSTGEAVAALDSVPVSGTPTYLRTGFDQTAPLEIVDTDRRGVSRVEATEMKRFQLTLGAPVTGGEDRYEGYVVANGRLRSLPIGAFLDRKTGDFFWQPGVGFHGTYTLLFVRVSGETRERIPVEVHISAR